MSESVIARKTFSRNCKVIRNAQNLPAVKRQTRLSISSLNPETIEQIAEILGIEPIKLFAQEISDSDEDSAEQKIDLKAMESQLRELISRDITSVFADL